jgi:hypothetical protein
MLDPAFCSRFQLSARTVITIKGIGEFERAALLAAIRRAFAVGRSVTVHNQGARQIELSLEENDLVLSCAIEGEGRRRVKLRGMAILSPRQDERSAAIDEILFSLGPTAFHLGAIGEIGRRRELTDQEAFQILEELSEGVVARQSRTRAALERGKTAFSDLVPPEWAYFEKFVGPDPCGALPEIYFSEILPAHWRRLLRADLAPGLELSLFGALRGDLTPVQLVNVVGNDTLWEAIEEAVHFEDPFSLLGALDLALDRAQRDARFECLAVKLSERLAPLRLEREDGTDVYDLMPALAEAVLNHLNTLEGAALRPPYWRRLCAWMQAGFLVRVTKGWSVKLKEFKEWLDSVGEASGAFRIWIDLRTEPMAVAHHFSAGQLRAEVLGRLSLMVDDYEGRGTPIPEKVKQQIDSAITQHKELILRSKMPGPLEGHRRPTIDKSVATDVAKVVEQHCSKLDSTFLDPSWRALGNLSQILRFDGHVLQSVAARVREAALPKDQHAREQAFNNLTWAAIVAPAHRNRELAEETAYRCIADAGKVQSQTDVQRLFQLLLIAASALEDEARWASWLEPRLVEMAMSVPAGEMAKAMHECINGIKQSTSLSLGIHCRAEALTELAC